MAALDAQACGASPAHDPRKPLHWHAAASRRDVGLGGLLGRVVYGSTGNRRHHQRQPPHEEIDSDEQTACPCHGPWLTRSDDPRDDQISNATDSRPRPRTCEHLPMLQRRQYLHDARQGPEKVPNGVGWSI